MTVSLIVVLSLVGQEVWRGMGGGHDTGSEAVFQLLKAR